MKKIIPFNNILEFDTNIEEITSISLEPTINKEVDIISGTFNISGEYSQELSDKVPFNFDLPFDIALGESYNMDTLEVDIDDFRYELISKNKLKVNIDLYLDGEILPPPAPLPEPQPPTIEFPEEQRKIESLNINSEKEDTTIFNSFTNKEQYITYHVYPVIEGDNLEKIIEKFQTTKEIIFEYNHIEEIIPGIKLIIPEKHAQNNHQE